MTFQLKHNGPTFDTETKKDSFKEWKQYRLVFIFNSGLEAIEVDEQTSMIPVTFNSMHIDSQLNTITVATEKLTPAGFEPASPSLQVECAYHYTTGVC